VSHFAAVLEPQLDSEIAIHRRPAAPRSLERPGTGTRPPAASPSPPRAAPPGVAEFDHIEEYLRSYLEDERFRSTHPLACGRWIVAWEMLWCADSRAKVIAVGQRAGEAMQAFGSSLLEVCAPLQMDAQWPELLTEHVRRARPLDAVNGVMEAYSEQLGEERSELLGGMLEHWDALADHVLRHAQGQPPERLRWEDGRRLALFTALVMVEVDRSFS
jgi:hypothetical protein